MRDANIGGFDPAHPTVVALMLVLMLLAVVGFVVAVVIGVILESREVREDGFPDFGYCRPE